MDLRIPQLRKKFEEKELWTFKLFLIPKLGKQASPELLIALESKNQCLFLNGVIHV